MAAYTGQLQVLVPGGFGDCQVDFFNGYSGFQRRRPKIQECFSSQLGMMKPCTWTWTCWVVCHWKYSARGWSCWYKWEAKQSHGCFLNQGLLPNEAIPFHDQIPAWLYGWSKLGFVWFCFHYSKSEISAFTVWMFTVGAGMPKAFEHGYRWKTNDIVWWKTLTIKLPW